MLSVLLLLLFLLSLSSLAMDSRNIATGVVISDEGYCDQPYVVITDDGNWLCVLTTGKYKEGNRDQHIIATISPDQGQTWSAPINIEPPGPPEASWAMPLKVPSGRVYVFYTYNTRNFAVWEGQPIRADSFGDIVFKYSDDHGRTWSAERYRIPQRRMEIDRTNFFGGREIICWCVGKPIIAGQEVFFGGSKVGHPAVGPGPTQGIFFASRNILTETNPRKIRWRLLPEGDVGLRAPQGQIAEEQNLVELSDGSLYCVYRTVDGFLCAATSRDRGRTWSGPEYARYSPGGRPIKNPRGPAFIRKFSNGKYLLLYYNHGGRDFSGRNPYWLSGGVERNGTIFWSEPEICLYDEDPNTRIGYPDYIEQDGRFWITETNKSIARLHEIDPDLIQGVWNQHELNRVARDGLVLDLLYPSSAADFPALPDPFSGGGYTLEMWLKATSLPTGVLVAGEQIEHGGAVAVNVTTQEAPELVLSTPKNVVKLDGDEGTITPGRWHHLVVTVDGGPKLVTFLVDGRLCDGGERCMQGWHRFDRQLSTPSITRLRIENSRLQLRRLRLYNRPLRTSEAVSNWRAGS
ncbi:MAG: exo-alpha-sialidase [Candidatus Zipacnadales bacterium]